tara:strand:+ start:430 stop:660 length:231 start_codon:yes stop_codon:yes gene_type:complete
MEKLGIPKKPKKSKPMKPQGSKIKTPRFLIAGLAGYINPKLKTVKKKGLKLNYSDGSSKTVTLKPMKQNRVKDYSI